MYNQEHQNVQLHSWSYFTFKEVYNDTLHAQIRVKMKKLWPQQVGEEKQAAKHKLCRGISRLCRDKTSNKARNFVATNLYYVVIKLEDKLCCDKVLLCRNKAKDKLCLNKVLLCGNKVLLCGNKVLLCRNKVLLCHNKVVDKLCHEKVLLCHDIVLGIQNANVATQKC